MSRACALAFVLVLAACGSSSSGTSKFDRETPQGALRGFFAAIDAGNIPDDLDQFFIDDFELSTWRMRCKTHGCAKADLRSLEVVEEAGYRAEYKISYVVRGRGGGPIMHGESSPVILQREGKRWYIAQFGQRSSIPAKAEATE